MIEGLVTLDGNTIGTFEIRPFPREELVVKLHEGLKVEFVFRTAALAGSKISLVVNP